MKREAIKNYYIYNRKQYSTKDMKIFDKIVSASIYEVIRIIQGIPLFLEQHLERMRKSAAILNTTIYKSNEEIISEILELISLNKCTDVNVKLVCSGLNKKEQDFFVYFIESHYPKKEVYDKGINTILYHSERENPNAKTINSNLRQYVNDAIKEKNAYEALLVNKEGYITEGSRSNIFFVKQDSLYTAPEKDVLLGVTREEVMRVCKKLDIKVKEELLHIKDLEKVSGAFITGTSVNVLPISKIENITINSVHSFIVKKIKESYEKEMKKYLIDKKWLGK